MNIRTIGRRPGQVQTPYCSTPAGRPGFRVGLILLSLPSAFIRHPLNSVGGETSGFVPHLLIWVAVTEGKWPAHGRTIRRY